MSVARRLAPSVRGSGLWLVLFALLGQLLLPWSAMPMVRGDGLPGSDICVTAPQSGSSPAAPVSPTHQSHNDAQCALHCLGYAGSGGLPAAAPLVAALVDFHHVCPWAPGGAAVPSLPPSPFAARAPPRQV